MCGLRRVRKAPAIFWQMPSVQYFISVPLSCLRIPLPPYIDADNAHCFLISFGKEKTEPFAVSRLLPIQPKPHRQFIKNVDFFHNPLCLSCYRFRHKQFICNILYTSLRSCLALTVYTIFQLIYHNPATFLLPLHQLNMPCFPVYPPYPFLSLRQTVLL